MKTALALVLAFVTMVFGQDSFRFPNNESACILAKFNATFELTLTKGNLTENVTVDLPATKDVSVDGNCPVMDGPSLELTFDKDDYKLVFTLSEKGDKVSAELQFVINHPNSTFKGLNYTEPVLLTNSGEEFPDLGHTNQSYLCFAPVNVPLESDETEFGITATIAFDNFQIQGYGVKNGSFSDPDECQADKTSTTASSTTAMTTPIPVPTGVGNYTLKDGNVTCLRMDANISIGVSYNDKKGKQMNRTVMVPGDAVVSGICQDEEITFTLAVVDKAEFETSGNLTLVFRKIKKYSFISSIEFSLDFSDANKTVTGLNGDTNNALSLSDQYFTCIEQTFMLEKDDVVLQDLKVQAFDLADGDFSTKSLDCNKPPPKTPTSSNYTVTDGNVTCISMVAAITLHVTYLGTNNKEKTININFEKNEPAYGKCSSENDTSEFIMVKYKDEKFSAELQFVKETKVSSNLGAEAFTFYVENITVTYTLDPLIFPDAKNPGEKNTFSLTNKKLYQTSSDKYYMCSAETTFVISPNVSLITRDLRLVAFNTDPKEPNLFGANAEDCAADTETNSVVPIAVGAALAGLVVIVLIAYLIGRRRNNKGYESV